MHGLQAHGGARQKEKRARILFDAGPSDVHHVPEGKLAKLILFLFGWGLISANMAQWLAAAAIEDGLEHADLKKLASIGKGGTYAGNCRRDLLSKFCKRMLLGKPSVIWVPMLNKVSDIFGQAAVLEPDCDNIFYLEAFRADVPSHVWVFFSEELLGASG